MSVNENVRNGGVFQKRFEGSESSNLIENLIDQAVTLASIQGKLTRMDGLRKTASQSLLELFKGRLLYLFEVE